jgi:hypothetical protein
MTMMPPETMQKREASYQKSQTDHPIFKRSIVYYIHTQHWQTDQQ